MMRSLLAILFLLGAAIAPAIRAQDQAAGAVPLAGKWHFVLDTGDGGREYDANFAVTDGKVGGTFGKNEVKGTIDGEKFNLEFPVESDEVGKGTLKMTGKIAQEQLTGSWAFQSYDGLFKATRPKAASSN